ncbi:hypothetical protein DIE19_03140 [Burkholderia sp. Bp9126]|nr:hypothetical protein DIE19_03140 [Burkholderia sp. Bp9126]
MRHGHEENEIVKAGQWTHSVLPLLVGLSVSASAFGAIDLLPRELAVRDNDADRSAWLLMRWRKLP